MLDALDDIAWDRLTHSLGPADDVPYQIRELLSPDPQVRAAALEELDENIFHQGIRYEATAYAVPFLLELVADEHTPDRAVLLEFLVRLAIGYDDEWLPQPVPIAELRRIATGGKALLEAAPHPGDDGYDDNMGFYPYWESLPEQQQAALDAWIQVAAYDAVRAGVPIFRSLAAADDPELATWAAYALAWFPEEAAGSLPVLTAAATRRSTADDDAQAVVAATAYAAIGLLGGTPDPDGLTDPDPRIRWGVAVALARAGRDADPGVAAVLHAWSRGEHAKEGLIPFLDGDVIGYAGRALGPHEDFDALLARLGEVSGMEAMPVARDALRAAFPSGATGEPDERQRALIRTLADSPKLWRLGGLPYANLRALIQGYGLPGDQEAMRHFAHG